jgi:outer membrane protein assembly factor BamB
MSATKVLDLAEKQGLLDAKVIADLRRQVAESKYIVTPEAIAKVLVDHEHLTPFQARKLVATALGEPPPDEPPKKTRIGPPVPDELTLADEEPVAGGRRRSPVPSPPEDDIILLEAVSPPAAPSPKPAPPRPSQKQPRSVPPAAPKAEAPRREVPRRETAQPAPSPAPSRAEPEELVELEAVAPPAKSAATSPPDPPSQPSKKSASWKRDKKASPPPSPPPADELVPLGPASAAAGLAPVASSAAVLTAIEPAPVDLAADPMALPLVPLSSDADGAAPFGAPRKARKNIWDSPLLLIGGGTLGLVIVAFALLYYALTRGTAKDLLAKADEEYKSGSYTSAMDAYQRFLKKYSTDPNVSYVRVRLGMAQLRQASEEGRNPRQGLASAKTVLPQIETEEKFSEARLELSTLLPDIADGFATQATQANETAQKQELVALADEAMQLVNNPSYLPASLRKDREARIAAILDKLKVAERSIKQDQELVAALVKIAAAEQQGDAAAAYQVRGELLKVYPALVADESLIAAVRKVGDKERELVQVNAESRAAATDDPQSGTISIVLAPREGPQPAAKAENIAFTLVEGAVYGLDTGSGRLLWRRHVGYETLTPPQRMSREAGADALVVDSRSHELLRLAADTGQVIWRQTIGQPFAAPLVERERIIVTTKAGQILQIDAAEGSVTGSAQLPQGASTAAAYDARQSQLVQLGEHSTLFVLAGDSLQCTETYYLGHARGSLLVPPVSVLDYVLAPESPADDHTLIHVLAPAGESKQLAEIGQPFRLKGRVTMPLAVAGRRIAAVTDRGQIAVYEVDAANKQQPVRFVAGLEATERVASPHYYTLDGNRLFVAGPRCSQFEIQSSLQTLARKWSRHQDDVFVAPLGALGDVLVHVRRRPDAPAVIVEGCRVDGGQTVWTTHLAAPVAALLPAAARGAADAITEQGRVFSLSSEQLSGAIVDAAAFGLPQGSTGSIFPELSAAPTASRVAWTETQTGGRIFGYDPATGIAPETVAPEESIDRAAGAAMLWSGNVVAPRTSGKVELLSLAIGKPASLPFLPTLKPDELPLWTRPAVLADGSGFVIGDGRQTLYRVALRDQPQPHLAAVTEQALETPLAEALVTVGDTIYGLARGETSDTIVAIDPQSLAIAARWPLAGRAQLGPEAAAGAAFVFSETDGLVCLEPGGKLRWQLPLAHGPLAGPPLAGAAGELLLLYQSGVLARVSAESGDEIASRPLGQPLGRAACLVGQQAVVAASDGSLLVVPLP